MVARVLHRMTHLYTSRRTLTQCLTTGGAFQLAFLPSLHNPQSSSTSNRPTAGRKDTPRGQFYLRSYFNSIITLGTISEKCCQERTPWYPPKTKPRPIPLAEAAGGEDEDEEIEGAGAIAAMGIGSTTRQAVELVGIEGEGGVQELDARLPENQINQLTDKLKPISFEPQ